MINEAQANMRANYINGGPGVLASGLVWLIAALVTWKFSFATGIIIFFIGGSFIHPVSVVISNILKDETPPPDKGMVRLSLLILPILFGGLFLAFMVSKQSPELFFPIMAMVIGLRYLIFQRVYGLKAFWTLGVVLTLMGAIAFFKPPLALPLAPAAIGAAEIMFGLWLTFRK